jgi:hypothetical protein
MTGGELKRMFTRRLAQSTLLFTLVIALLLVFIISWLVLIAEQGAPNSNIKTYHDAVWWPFVTITTVSYGDYYPVTGWVNHLHSSWCFLALASLEYYPAISSTFISLHRRRKEKREGVNEHNHDSDADENEDTAGDETSSNLEAELAAIKGELAALRQLFEERYRKQ